MDAFGNIDSKYRFIILAAKRAKQLLKGAKPKAQTKSKNPIRIAQSEVRNGLIEFEILPTTMEEAPEREERVFVGGGLGDESVESEGPGGKGGADEEPEAEPGEEHGEGEGREEDEGAEEDGEDEDSASKDEKDE